MAEKDLPSNSDESDEDFVPEGNGSSEEISTSGPSDGDSDHEKGEKSRKRRKVTRKKVKKCDGDQVEEESELKTEVATDVDALWADFKEDVNKMEEQIVSNQKKLDDKQNDLDSEKKPVKILKKTVKLNSDSKRKSFPGTMNSGSKLGLNKILNQLGKKEKLSTLAKSKMDWNNFKKSEGIEEEIKTHNRGKDGYLEKQDFLQRTDLRQFEIEKQLRTSKRHF